MCNSVTEKVEAFKGSDVALPSDAVEVYTMRPTVSGFTVDITTKTETAGGISAVKATNENVGSTVEIDDLLIVDLSGYNCTADSTVFNVDDTNTMLQVKRIVGTSQSVFADNAEMQQNLPRSGTLQAAISIRKTL